MRGLDGRLQADLGDNEPTNISGSVTPPATSSINENLTSYVLLPEIVNRAPIISQSIYKTSTPEIKPIQFNDPGTETLIVDEQGVVKIIAGTSFILKLKGKQPPIYNIENGRPTLIVDQLPTQIQVPTGVQVTTGSQQSGLIYSWEKDGESFIREVDNKRVQSEVIVTGSSGDELHFYNTSARFAGTYNCIISNDIGSTESELITIEVYNPDLEDYFYTNLVNNPYGKDGLNEWLTPDSEFITARLSNAEFNKFNQPWNQDTFGYSADMFYPRPYHINTYHIKNSNLSKDILQEGYYFTRESYKYKAKDGKAIINAEYDIDLSEIRDYIQGAVYGVDGVRAIFGTYIGNAISKYKTTLITAITDYRSFKNTVNLSEPRPLPSQGLISGVPTLSEAATVIITEMDNETPLLSIILDVDQNTTSSQPGVVFYDPWTKYIKDVPPGTKSFPSGTLASGYETLGDTMEERIYYVISSSFSYPDRSYIPTFGQYAEWNRSVIDKLNFKTNKIRINIVFTATHDLLDVTTGEFLDDSDECFEFVPWELITKVGRFPQVYPNDFVSASIQGRPTQSIYLNDYNRTFYGSGKELKDYTTLLGAPRLLVTGLNLVLVPLESVNKPKVDYYTKTILAADVNPTAYTAVISSVESLSPLAEYIQSLNYTTEYIGVHVTNQWKVPHRTFGLDAVGRPNQSDNLKYGYGDIASTTAISTFKFKKNPSLLEPQGEIEDLLNDSKYMWERAGLEDLIDNISGSVEVIYYSGSELPATEVVPPDIKDTIQSGILHYITSDRPINIPSNFVTTSISDPITYKRNLGFNLNMELHKVGHPTASLTSESIARAWREPDPSWIVPTIKHKHNLLQNIQQDYIDITTNIPPTGQGPAPAPPGLTGSWQVSFDPNFLANNSSWFSSTTNASNIASSIINDSVHGRLAYYSRRNIIPGTSQQNNLYEDVSESFVRFRLKDDQLPTTVGWLFVGLEGWTTQSAQQGPLGEPIERYGWLFDMNAYVQYSDYTVVEEPHACVYQIPNISNDTIILDITNPGIYEGPIPALDTQPGTPGGPNNTYYPEGVTYNDFSIPDAQGTYFNPYTYKADLCFELTSQVTGSFFEIRATTSSVSLYISGSVRAVIPRQNPNTNLRFLTSGIYEGITALTYGPLDLYPIGYPATNIAAISTIWLEPVLLT